MTIHYSGIDYKTNSEQAKCVMELKKQTEGHPEFANFDDLGDGQSNGAVSGADTPLTAGTPGQPKLKLRFNNTDGAADLDSTDFGADED